MSEIRIYGASDDLIEVEGGIDEEFSEPDGKWFGVLKAPDGSRALVFADYGADGCWSVGAGQVAEGVPLASWPISIRQGTEKESVYSVVLVIDAPDGTVLSAEAAQ